MVQSTVDIAHRDTLVYVGQQRPAVCVAEGGLDDLRAFAGYLRKHGTIATDYIYTGSRITGQQKSQIQHFEVENKISTLLCDHPLCFRPSQVSCLQHWLKTCSTTTLLSLGKSRFHFSLLKPNPRAAKLLAHRHLTQFDAPSNVLRSLDHPALISHGYHTMRRMPPRLLV